MDARVQKDPSGSVTGTSQNNCNLASLDDYGYPVMKWEQNKRSAPILFLYPSDL
jgi:hypothetical protein